MELSEEDKFGLRIDPSSLIGNLMSSSSQCPSVSIDSLCSEFYNQPTALQGKPLPSSWNQGILSHFQIDSAFIERAARFSSFTSGNFSAIANNPFTANASKNLMADQRDIKGSNNVSGEAEFSGDCKEEATNFSPKGNGANKRKRSNQDMELHPAQGASSHSVETTKENLDSKKKGEKKAKDGSDEQKDSYIHVRARRGQATNSHSLAERVRREKISQRMKFLQELVPGCSKVTGKAVMLDEIINYVQSLQRQVEFLSMKLASVNPRLDFNIEGLSSKDILQLSGGSSSAIGFSSDMIQPQFHPSHLNLVQVGIPSMINSSDAIKRAINSQLNSINGYKDIAHQMPNAWEDELHNVLQMNYGSIAPLNAQELNGKPCEGFPL